MIKKRKQQHKLNQNIVDNKPIVGLFGLFSILFIISPFFRGQFFLEDYHMINVLIQVLLILTVALYYSKVKEMGQSNRILIVLFAIPLIYTIAYWYSIYPFYAANEALKWFSYSAVFLMLIIWMSVYQSIKRWLYAMCWITLYWIVVLVFLVDLKVLQFQDAIIWSRFSSVFQYPNTYASIVSAFLIIALMGLSKRIHIGYQLIYGLSLIPFMLSFLYTESRGGILVLALGWMVGLLFLSWKEQISYFIITSLVAIGSLILFSTYRSFVEEGSYTVAALSLVGVTALYASIVILAQKYIYPRYTLSASVKKNILIPAGLFSLAIVGAILLATKAKESVITLLPEALQVRISSINLAQHSVQERFLFYKDSFTVWTDHFWLGAGGGGWRALFESYKSLPYFSTQAHSFYMQTLVEVGLIGSVFVFGFFLYIMIKGIRTFVSLEPDVKNQHHLLAPSLVAVIILMLHNVIDFNMSFGTYNLFLFTLLAIIWSYIHKNKEGDKAASNAVLSRMMSKIPSLSYKNRNILVHAVIILLIVVSLFSAYKSYAYAQAESLFKQAQQGGDYQQTLERTDRAIAFNSNDPKLREIKIQLLNHAYNEYGSDGYLVELDEEYQTLIRLNPTNFLHYLRYAEFLGENGRHEEALAQMDLALEYGPWQQSVYEEVMKYRVDYSLNRVEANDQVEVKNQIIEINKVMSQLEDKLMIQEQELPKGLELTNPIGLTEDNRLLFGKTYYYLGEFERSLEYLSAIDLSKLEGTGKQNLMLYMLLNYEALNEQNKLSELLETNIAKGLNIDQMYQQVKNDPMWVPFSKK